MPIHRSPIRFCWFALVLGVGCGAASPAAFASERGSGLTAVPEEFPYVCPDPAHTKTYDHPGRCPLCGKLLQAEAPAGVKVEYFCPRHPSRKPSSTPGICPAPGCGRYLHARHVQPTPEEKAQYVCPNRAHAKRYAKPGRCEVCGKLLRVWNPAHLPVEYRCPVHHDVTSAKPGRCTEEDCPLYLEAHWLQPKPAEAFVYRCPVKGHTQEFDRPGRCPRCNMYLEAKTKHRVRYECPNPDHEYYLDRPGKCGVAGCPYYLEARPYTEPPPPKRAWYEAAWDWLGSLLHGRDRKGNR